MLGLIRSGLAALSLAALLASAPASAQSGENDPRLAEARRRFDEAIRVFEAGDYSGSLAEFERIYGLLEGHPRRFFVLFNIGRCHEELFRYDAALDAYQRYLRDGGVGTPQEQDARRRIADLEPRLAVVTIQSNVPAEVWIDGHLVGRAPGDLRVTGGSHTIELRARGHAPARHALQIAARTRESVSLTLDRVSAGISPIFFFSGAALTVIAGGIGAGFGGVALAEQGTISSRLSSGDPRLRYQVTQAQIDSMEQSALIADVFFGTALVFGVASVVLLFVTDWGGSETSGAASLELLPFASDTSIGLAGAGRF